VDIMFERILHDKAPVTQTLQLKITDLGAT